jgi:replicative DNA helicase
MKKNPGERVIPVSRLGSAQDIHRTPPHSVEAEQGVLGSMLISSSVIEEVVDRITDEYFYVPSHQTIYAVLLDLWNKKQPTDLITFTQVLRDRNLLETVGGPALVTSLFTFVPTAANVGYYLEIVRDKYILRSIIAGCTEAVRRAYEEQDEVHLCLDKVLGDLTLLAQEGVREDSLRHIWQGVLQTLEKFELAHANRGEDVIHGIATGFHDLDRMTSGFRKQQLITIAALTSHGKSAIANNIADHMAVVEHVPVGKWSLEMSYDEESDRFTCSRARVSLQRIRDGFFSDKDIDEIPKRVEPFREAPLWVDDTRGLSILDLRARIMRGVRKYGLKCAIVDYLGLLNSPSKRAQSNRAIEIGEITYGLKSLAKELDIPIILAAQLNRESDKRASVFRRPKLSDLKDSSSIEQDSDVVMFIWRPGRFVEVPEDRERLEGKLKLEEINEKLLERVREQEQIDGQAFPYAPLTIDDYAEVIVAKQRNGPVSSEKNKIVLRFLDDLTRFENVTPKVWSNRPDERQQHEPE